MLILNIRDGGSTIVRQGLKPSLERKISTDYSNLSDFVRCCHILFSPIAHNTEEPFVSSHLICGIEGNVNSKDEEGLTKAFDGKEWCFWGHRPVGASGIWYDCSVARKEPSLHAVWSCHKNG